MLHMFARCDADATGFVSATDFLALLEAAGLFKLVHSFVQDTAFVDIVDAPLDVVSCSLSEFISDIQTRREYDVYS
jgi:hypothetical protein